MIDYKFMESLPENNELAIKEICEHFFRLNKNTGSVDDEKHNHFLIFIAFYKAFAESRKLKDLAPKLTDDTVTNITEIHNFFLNLYRNAKKKVNNLIVAQHKSQFDIKLGTKFAYEFSDDDFDRIQELINELREIVKKSKCFEDEYEDRLLKRINKLQEEFDKKMTGLDKFWGIMGDAGIAVGKFGIDAKPMFDQVERILKIVYKTQAKAEGVENNLSLPFCNNKQIEDNS